MAFSQRSLKKGRISIYLSNLVYCLGYELKSEIPPGVLVPKLFELLLKYVVFIVSKSNQKYTLNGDESRTDYRRVVDR